MFLSSPLSKARAPLMPLPVISTPFDRLWLDRMPIDRKEKQVYFDCNGCSYNIPGSVSHEKGRHKSSPWCSSRLLECWNDFTEHSRPYLLAFCTFPNKLLYLLTYTYLASRNVGSVSPMSIFSRHGNTVCQLQQGFSPLLGHC